MEQNNIWTRAYESAAERLRDVFSDITALMDKGQIPSGEQVDALKERLEQLQAAYRAMREQAELLCAQEAANAEARGTPSLYTYASMVEKARRAQHREELVRSLQRFLRLASPVPAYDDALAPYREEAQRLLGRFRSSDASGRLDEERVRRTEEFQLFLQAVDFEEFESEQATEVLDRLETAFTAKTQRGLILKKYAVMDAPVSAPPSKSAPPPPESAPQPPEEAADESGPKVRSRNRIKSAKASATAFRKEVCRMPKEVQVVVPLFTNLGVLTAPECVRFGELTHCFKSEARDETMDGVTRTLNQLVSRGIAAVYDLPGEDDPVYCLTRYGLDCLAKNSICVDMRGFWHLSFGRCRICAQEEMSEAFLRETLGHTQALLRYLDYAWEHCGSDLYRTVKSSIRWDVDHFNVAVPDQMGMPGICVLHCGGQRLDWGQDALLAFPDCRESVPEGEGMYFALDDEGMFRWEDGAWVPHDLDQLFPDDDDDDGGDDEDDGMDDEAGGDEHEDDGDEPAREDDTPPPEEYALSRRLAQSLLDAGEVPEEGAIRDLILQLLREDTGDWQGLKNALLLARAASFRDGAPRLAALYNRLSLGTNMGLDQARYSGLALIEAFSSEDELNESCRFAAFLYGSLFPDEPYDYALRTHMQVMLESYDNDFPSYPALKDLLRTAYSVCGDNIAPEGFTPQTLESLCYQDQSAAHSQELKARALSLLPEPKVKARITGIPDLLYACFGKDSELHFCLQAVADDDREQRDGVLAVMAGYTNSLDDLKISDELVAETVEQEWKNATRGKKTSGLSLEYQARRQVDEAFYQRLELICEWLSYSDPEKGGSLPELRRVKDEVLTEIESGLRALTEEQGGDGQVVVRWMLELVRRRLLGQSGDALPYEQLLRTGFISLDDHGMPVLREELERVKYAEPWRSVLAHIATPPITLEQAGDRIRNSDSPTYQNLGQLKLIGRCLGDDSEMYTVSEDELKEARDAAHYAVDSFQDSLELALVCGRVSRQERQDLDKLAIGWLEDFTARQDFGCYRQFLDALRRQVDELAAGRTGRLRARLDACQAEMGPQERSSLLEEARRLLEAGELSAAEEHCARFESGERDCPAPRAWERGGLEKFLSDEVYAPLYNECVRREGQSLSQFGPAYLTDRAEADGVDMLSAWPVQGQASCEQMEKLLRGLGLNVGGARQDSERAGEFYAVDVVPAPQGLPEYPHPIAALGTRAKGPLGVAVLYGVSTEEEVVDAIDKLRLTELTVVLVDAPLDQTARRAVGDAYHSGSLVSVPGDDQKRRWENNTAPFLIIDQVLALHLAMTAAGERLPVMLKCTLPFACFQPFPEVGENVPDEMFCGRQEELSAVTDLDGPFLVCGGRQMGKTALLQRARGVFQRERDKALAVYSSLGTAANEQEAAQHLGADVAWQTHLALAPCQNLGDLAGQLEDLFMRGAFSSLLLLVDDCDNFLAGIAGEGYAPLRALQQLRQSCQGRFKFVLACLHNVCRDAPEFLLGQALCLTPLSPAEAMEMLARPLEYMGFQLREDCRLACALACTNYAPGDVSALGGILASSLWDTSRRQAPDSVPPFLLGDAQLGYILYTVGFSESAADRFRRCLAGDPRYLTLARCVALLCYESPDASGKAFSLGQIMDMAAQAEAGEVAKLGPAVVEGLLDEMAGMGVLSRQAGEEPRYRLRRQGLLGLIGPDADAVLADMILPGEVRG